MCRLICTFFVHILGHPKNITFVSPYPTLFLRYGAGWKIIFLTSQISYPFNLKYIYFVNNSNIGNKIDYINNAELKIFYDSTDYNRQFRLFRLFLSTDYNKQFSS